MYLYYRTITNQKRSLHIQSPELMSKLTLQQGKPTFQSAVLNAIARVNCYILGEDICKTYESQFLYTECIKNFHKSIRKRQKTQGKKDNGLQQLNH